MVNSFFVDECNDCYLSPRLAFNWGMSTSYLNSVEIKDSLNAKRVFTGPSKCFMGLVQGNSFSNLQKKQSQGKVCEARKLPIPIPVGNGLLCICASNKLETLEYE